MYVLFVYGDPNCTRHGRQCGAEIPAVDATKRAPLRMPNVLRAKYEAKP